MTNCILIVAATEDGVRDQAIAYAGIPFDLKVKQPNTATLHAMKELEDGQGTMVESTSNLFRDLGGDIPND